MRQLYEKSGSTARFSDFALDVRRLVEVNALPEYHLSGHRNVYGEEVVQFFHRATLRVDHPDHQMPRFPGRRQVPAN